MIRLLVISICVLLCACGTTESLENSQANEALPGTGNILVANTELHTFSDPVKPDTFRIRLVGDSINIATATFEIVGHDGRLLYTESFTSDYLLNYNTPLNPTPAQRNEFILNRIDTFFAEENFKMPAITPEMTFDPNYANEATWNEIKADTNAIGFYYLIGKEDGRWLAYSRSQQKVVLYFNCC